MINEKSYMREYMRSYRSERKLVPKPIKKYCANCNILFEDGGKGHGNTKYCLDCKILSMEGKLKKKKISG